METFAKGELVVMQHATHFSHWNGTIAVVVGALATRNPLDLNTRKRVALTSYKVLPIIEGGIEVVCEPHQMRKLRKPDAATEKPAVWQVETSEPEPVD
ncbi:MAG: hypothetical protein RQ847_10320 [Wenzhouxiangellaceae bacterium]|nr:hypothetical protein [Wenzhouxiangellaceae bacterium]